MKFLAILPMAATLALVAAVPSPAPVEQGLESVTLANSPTPDQLLHLESGVVQAAKRSLVEERGIEKRADGSAVGVWEHKNNGGIKRVFGIDYDTCFNFGAPWNDNISSLEVESGDACVFFKSFGCNFNEHARLYVFGQFIGDLDPWGLDNAISSVYCYKP